MLATAGVFLGVLLMRRKQLRSEQRIESFVSREASFLLNNWLFIALLLVVFWGTLFPVFSEALTGKRIALGPKFFNGMAFVPTLLLLFLTGVGPLIAWRRSSPTLLRRQFALPAAAGVAGGLLVWAWFGRELEFYLLMVCALGAFVTGTVVQEYTRAIRVRVRKGEENALQAFASLLRKNQQRYGGYIVHLGVVLVLLGTAGSVLNEERLENVRPGSEIRLHDYRLRYLTAEPLPAQHYGGAQARIALYEDEQPIAVMAAREAHVLAGAAARVDPVDPLDAPGGPLRDPHGARGRRLRHAQGLSQSAGLLDLDRRRRLRARHARRDVAASEPRRGAAQRMIRAARWAAALIALAAATGQAQTPPPATPDVPGGPGTIQGRIVHASRPAAAAGLPVLLYALPENAPPGVREGVADAEGRFVFSNVSNDPGTVYLIGVRVGEVPFGVRIRFAGGEREHAALVAISDPVADAAGVSVEEAHWQLESGCESLLVNEAHTLRNPTSRVIHVPESERQGRAPLFRTTLPEGATGFEGHAGMFAGGLVFDGRHVDYWGPLYPGEQMLDFGWALPAKSGDALLARVFDSGAGRLRVRSADAAPAPSRQAPRRGTRRPPGRARLAGAGRGPGGARRPRRDRGRSVARRPERRPFALARRSSGSSSTMRRSRSTPSFAWWSASRPRSYRRRGRRCSAFPSPREPRTFASPARRSSWAWPRMPRIDSRCTARSRPANRSSRFATTCRPRTARWRSRCASRFRSRCSASSPPTRESASRPTGCIVGAASATRIGASCTWRPSRSARGSPSIWRSRG